MLWKLKCVNKETDHKFLNFYTYMYEVEKEGEKTDYPYFVASRHDAGDVIAKSRNYARPDGVLMMVINDQEEPSVLLIRQFRPPMNATIIEFPAGLLEETDEDELAAAKRESVEEAGVEIIDAKVIAPSSPTSSGLSDELVSIVEARVGGLTATHLERFEDIQARFVPLKDIPAMLEDPELIIALNVRLCLMYALEKYLRK